MLGQALRDLGVKREDVIIATKVRGRTGAGPNAVGLSRGHIMDQIAGSLKRLGLDHVDLYQIHGFDPATPIEETLRALDDCVSRGLVRTIGCSNLAAWQIMKALGISDKRGFARFETVQAYYTIAGARSRARDPAAGRGPGAGRHGLEPARRRVAVWQVHPRQARRQRFAPRGVRFPAGRQRARLRHHRRHGPIAKAHDVSVARVALAWLLQRNGVMSVIIGAKTIEQLDDNLAAAKLTLSAEEIATLDQVKRAAGPNIRAGCWRGRARGAYRRRKPDLRRVNAGPTREFIVQRVKWGVLGVAKIAVEKVIPAMQRGEFSRDRRDRLARSRQGERGRRTARHPARLRLLRGTAGRSRDRGGLQSAAQRTACPVDDPRARCRQACIVREADRARRRRSASADRGAQAVRQAGRGSLHGALSSAMAARARDLWRSGAIGEGCARSRRSSPTACSIPDNVRNRPPGGGGLYDIGCYADPDRALHFRRRADRAWSRLWTATPNFGTDRLVSAILEFPGGRHLTFSAATQLSAHQRVDDRRRCGADRGRNSVQRAARPADEDRDRHRRRPLRRRRAHRGIPCLRSIHAAGRRLFARRARRRRRSNFRSRTRWRTCASSTRCSARPSADRGRRRRRDAIGEPRRPKRPPH